MMAAEAPPTFAYSEHWIEFFRSQFLICAKPGLTQRVLCEYDRIYNDTIQRIRQHVFHTLISDDLNNRQIGEICSNICQKIAVDGLYFTSLLNLDRYGGTIEGNTLMFLEMISGKEFPSFIRLNIEPIIKTHFSRTDPRNLNALIDERRDMYRE